MKKISLSLIFLLTFNGLIKLNVFAEETSDSRPVEVKTVAPSEKNQPVNNQDLQSRFQEIQKEIAVLQAKNLSGPEKLDLAILFKRTGQDEISIKLCQEVLGASPEDSRALYELADLYKRNYQLIKAKNLFLKIPEQNPEFNYSQVKLMEINVLLRDREAAENLIRQINKTNDLALLNTVMGIYNSSALKLDPGAALENFEKAVSLDLQDLTAKYYLANIYLDKNRRPAARKLFNQVIAHDFFNSTAHSMLGFLEFIDGNKKRGVEELKTALAVNPMDLRALTSYGNGMTIKNYKILEANRPDLIQSPEFLQAGRLAVGYINHGRFREAKYLIEQLQKKYPENIHSYIQAGSLEVTIGEPEAAINLFKKALNISREYGLANNGMAVAIRNFIKNQENNSRTLDLKVYDYSLINTASLEKVFINYHDLPEKYQEIVKYSIYPLKNYIPVLAASGSTHYIIPLYERSTDYKYGIEFKNLRSFDFRLWDDIRGRGGFNSATGIEDLLGSYNLEFNTLTHEFAHQVHGFAMTQKQQEKIKILYNLAKRDNRFMDYYAGSNEYEYFAQGVEAYNSTQGKVTLKATAKNTREILARTDKPLYEFIKEVIVKDNLTENFAVGYTRKGDNFYKKGDFLEAEKSYKQALNVSPGYYSALTSLGKLYSYFKTAKEAKKLHQQAIEKIPHHE